MRLSVKIARFVSLKISSKNRRGCYTESVIAVINPMPEQLELFRDTEIPASTQEKATNYEAMTDDELHSRLAAALGIVGVGTEYDMLIDTPAGKKLTLDRARVIPLLQNPELAEEEKARRLLQNIEDRTSGPEGVD